MPPTCARGSRRRQGDRREAPRRRSRQSCRGGGAPEANSWGVSEMDGLSCAYRCIAPLGTISALSFPHEFHPNAFISCPSPELRPTRLANVRFLVTGRRRGEHCWALAPKPRGRRAEVIGPRHARWVLSMGWRAAGRKESRGRQTSVPVGRPSDGGLCRPPYVSMMQATDFGDLHELAYLRRLDGPPIRRILLEREMRSCAVVVREVCGQRATQVPFVQDENLIQALAPDRPDEPLRERGLPRAVGCNQHFTDPLALHSAPERVIVDAVAIAEQIGRGGVIREGMDDLLSRPGGGGMLGDIEVKDAPAMVGEHDQDEEDAHASGRTVKKSIETSSRTWLVRNVRQVCDGDERRLGSSRETVRSATSRPSFSSSPWILGAPHSGLAAAILRDQGADLGVDPRPAHGGASGERGPVVAEASPLPSQHGGWRNNARARLHPAHIRDSPTQQSRSRPRSFGRVTVRVYTASCWRRARFSRASWRWPPQRHGKTRSR